MKDKPLSWLRLKQQPKSSLKRLLRLKPNQRSMLRPQWSNLSQVSKQTLQKHLLKTKARKRRQEARRSERRARDEYKKSMKELLNLSYVVTIVNKIIMNLLVSLVNG